MKRAPPPPPPPAPINAVAGPSRTSWEEEEEEEEEGLDASSEESRVRGGETREAEVDGLLGKAGLMGKEKDELSEMIEAMRKGEVDESQLSGEEDSEEEEGEEGEGEGEVSLEERERRLSLISSHPSVSVQVRKSFSFLPSFDASGSRSFVRRLLISLIFSFLLPPTRPHPPATTLSAYPRSKNSKRWTRTRRKSTNETERNSVRLVLRNGNGRRRREECFNVSDRIEVIERVLMSIYPRR